MTELSDNFKNLISGKEFKPNMLVPMLVWSSAKESNIEACNAVNKRFFKVPKEVLARQLTLTNKLTHFVRYPSVTKEDKKIKFFYDDLCNYFGWTKNELKKNMHMINIDEMKEKISKLYAYDNKQRKILKLKKLKW